MVHDPPSAVPTLPSALESGGLNPLRERTDAFERYGYRSAGPLVLSCEHASSRVPSPLQTTASDREILETHWGYDIGAREVTLGLAKHTSSAAVLARFSRLICDPNRHHHRDDLILSEVEGEPLSFNRHIDEAEVARRIEAYHEPFHQAIHRVLAERVREPEPTLLLSVHSFTPLWERRLRTMDIGILFDRHEETALALRAALEAEGFFVELNAPYSAMGTGLMYSAERHGRGHQVTHLELELNQALICTPERQRRVSHRVGSALRRIWPPTPPTAS